MAKPHTPDPDIEGSAKKPRSRTPEPPVRIDPSLEHDPSIISQARELGLAPHQYLSLVASLRSLRKRG